MRVYVVMPLSTSDDQVTSNQRHLLAEMIANIMMVEFVPTKCFTSLCAVQTIGDAAGEEGGMWGVGE